VGFGGFAAGCTNETKKANEADRDATHVRQRDPLNGEFNTEGTENTEKRRREDLRN
jgi:hypothetical protein